MESKMVSYRNTEFQKAEFHLTEKNFFIKNYTTIK